MVHPGSYIIIASRPELSAADAFVVLKVSTTKIISKAKNADIKVLFESADLNERADINIFISFANVMPDVGSVEGYDEASFAPILAADAPPVPGVWVYSATKAAIAKMFDYLQEEHPERHVVQIQPVVISTGLKSHLGVVSEDEPELVGQFALWLASSEAKFLKGKFVWVNWNVNELKARADEIKNSWLLRIPLNGVVM
ncbi:NAD(P)-binding protein [Trichoderma evansii]